MERGLKVLQAQGKYLNLDADTVLVDLRKIADGEVSSIKELNPDVLAFLAAEFSPGSMREALFETEWWEQYAEIAIDLMFPSPAGKTAAVQRIGGKLSKEALAALEAKFGADLLVVGAKGGAFPGGQSVAQLEKYLSGLPPGERVAQIKSAVASVTVANGLVKDVGRHSMIRLYLWACMFVIVFGVAFVGCVIVVQTALLPFDLRQGTDGVVVRYVAFPASILLTCFYLFRKRTKISETIRSLSP